MSAPAQARTSRYLTNVLWTWLSSASFILTAFLVWPYQIRKLGSADSGAWTTVLSLVEYYWLIDIGLRSATVKLSAEYRTKDRTDLLSQLISTGVLYSSIAGALVAVATFFIAPHADRIFLHINHPVFRKLVLIVGFSWALGLVFNVFGACVEGFQRFDLLGRVWIGQTILRSIGVTFLLWRGYGLLYVGYMLLATQLFNYTMTGLVFLRVAPDVKVSWKNASFQTFRSMAAYGIHSFTTIVSTRLLAALPTVIARFSSLEYVTYFNTPMRIMDYAMDGVGRVGQVTTPNATELVTSGKRKELADLAVFANRYCLLLFLPLAPFLLVYRYEFFGLWVKAKDVVAASAPLLPLIVLSHALVSGQFNSVSILFGMGRHAGYARSYLAEAFVTLGGMAFVLPRYGLLGAVILAATAMTVNRVFVAAILLCRELDISPVSYLSRIYAGPLAIGAVCGAGLYAMKRLLLPGHTWTQLILAGLALMVPYMLLTFRFCMLPHHKEAVLRKLRLA